MKKFAVKPEIYMYDKVKEFVEDINIKKTDLIITNESRYNQYFGDLNLECHVLFREKYGKEEPSDEMVEAIYNDIKDLNYKRIIAVGGGTTIDVAKFFALKELYPVLDLYDGKIDIQKAKELIVVPTTCGTGSEVTNVSILELKSRKTKKGMAVEEMYPDKAVLIPELLEKLPFKFFATSSLDALVHAVESLLSPKASPFTEMYSYKAIETILKSYKIIAENGEEARKPLLNNLLLASTFAGISFGNAGCAAVHAMSYPLGGIYHVPHGEANYAMFTGVLEKYGEKTEGGKLEKLNKFICDVIGCSEENVYEELENLLNKILMKKLLREYGVKEEEIYEFADSVIENQGRLMSNNYVELNRDDLINIYKKLW